MVDDRLMIHGIRFHGYHGASEEERTLGRNFSIDVDLTCDTRPAASRDRLEDAVDYAKVFAAVLELGRGAHCQLLETLADRIAAHLLHSFPVQAVRVRIHKYAPPLQGSVDFVGVEITRARGD